MTDVTRNDSLPAVPVPAGNMATGILKLLALVFMFVDHSGKVLFNNMTEMRTIGRIAFPLYVWGMIVGFSRTRDVGKYVIRLLQVWLISQPLYLFALNSEGHIGVMIERTFLPLAGGYSAEGLRTVLYTIFLEKPNIFLTLMMGLIALAAIRDRNWLRKVWNPLLFLAGLTVISMMYNKAFDPIISRMAAPFENGFSFAAVGAFLKTTFWDVPNYFFLIVLVASILWAVSGKERRMGQVWGPAAMILLATMLRADYGWKGILLFVLLYAVQVSRPGIAAVMVSFMLFWGSSYQMTAELFGKKIDLSLLPDSIAGPVRTLLHSETYSLAGLPLILLRFPKDLHMPRWLSYLLYPGHLVLLIVLKVIMFGWFA